jgi:hypothetical protein
MTLECFVIGRLFTCRKVLSILPFLTQTEGRLLVIRTFKSWPADVRKGCNDVNTSGTPKLRLKSRRIMKPRNIADIRIISYSPQFISLYITGVN